MGFGEAMFGSSRESERSDGRKRGLGFGGWGSGVEDGEAIGGARERRAGKCDGGPPPQCLNTKRSNW